MNLYLIAGGVLLLALSIAVALVVGAVVKRRDMQIPHEPHEPRHYGEKTFNLGDWNGN